MTMTGELEGTTFLVTGANTGIGRATTEDLSRRGGRGILACRSAEKTQPVIGAQRGGDAGRAGRADRRSPEMEIGSQNRHRG